MIPKQERVVVTFYTTAEAMATEKLCAAHGLPGKLISAPRTLSADCGIAWSGPADTADALRAALERGGVEYAGFHTMTL